MSQNGLILENFVNSSALFQIMQQEMGKLRVRKIGGNRKAIECRKRISGQLVRSLTHPRSTRNFFTCQVENSGPLRFFFFFFFFFQAPLCIFKY